MGAISADDASSPDALESQEASRGKRAWLIAGVVAASLLMCGCASTVFLVLTGIIAEPETVIEQIVRAVTGG